VQCFIPLSCFVVMHLFSQFKERVRFSRCRGEVLFLSDASSAPFHQHRETLDNVTRVFTDWSREGKAFGEGKGSEDLCRRRFAATRRSLDILPPNGSIIVHGSRKGTSECMHATACRRRPDPLPLLLFGQKQACFRCRSLLLVHLLCD
jgi:hypothetical protein